VAKKQRELKSGKGDTWRKGTDYKKYREAVIWDSMGPRCYELAATGTFFISEYRPEVEEVFGDLVPTFDTPDEMARLVGTYIQDPARREAVQRELPGAVAAHTWHDRARQLVDDLDEVLLPGVPKRHS